MKKTIGKNDEKNTHIHTSGRKLKWKNQNDKKKMRKKIALRSLKRERRKMECRAEAAAPASRYTLEKEYRPM